MTPTLEHMLEFVRNRTAPAPVPLAPELALYQASELTPLWRATAAELEASDPAPFWAFPWAGGQALARHVLDHPSLVRGKVVLDFGTGSGLVAIAAARAGAARVEGCDVDPFCEAAVALNAQLNGVDVRFRHGSPLGERDPRCDVVLAGDIFYERPLAESALAWLSFLASTGVRALVGDPGRVYSPAQGLSEISTYEVPTSPEIESGHLLRTRVLEILPPCPRA